MSLIPHSFFPRSAMDMDQWFHPPHMGQNTLDLFDPFDELDHTMARNMQWLSKPDFMPVMPIMPKVPQKYRITLDCVGYKPESIKTSVQGNILSVVGREEVKHSDGDYHIKEFKKTYTLPERAESDKLVCFLTGQGQLCIEVPLREDTLHKNYDLFPQIVDGENGTKAMSMTFAVPEKIHPEKIHVSIKDRDLIVKAEDKYEKPDGVSKFYYYKRTTLPENTDFTHLQCKYDNHEMTVCAPLGLEYKPHKRIPVPIMCVNSQKAIGGKCPAMTTNTASCTSDKMCM